MESSPSGAVNFTGYKGSGAGDDSWPYRARDSAPGISGIGNAGPRPTFPSKSGLSSLLDYTDTSCIQSGRLNKT